MNKALFVFIIFSIIFSSCKKNEDKIISGNPKKLINKLDLSYFPAKTTALAIVDFNSIYAVEAFKPMIKELFINLKKETDIDFSNLNYIAAYINIKNLKNNPFENSAIILDGIRIDKIKNLPPAIKTEKFEGVKLNLYDDNTGYAVVENKTIGGTVSSLKNAILLNKGKAKNLASTPKNTVFKGVISKLKGSQVNIVFVVNDDIKKELDALTKAPGFFIIKKFIDDFKAAGFGIKADNKYMYFDLILRSSAQGVKTLDNIIKTQLENIKKGIDKELSQLTGVITEQGVNILKNVFNTLKIKADNEYLLVSLKLSMDDASKISEIFMMMGLMPVSKGFNGIKRVTP